MRPGRTIAGLLGLLALAVPAVQAAENPLVLGIFPRFSASETTTRYTPLAEYLREQLGRPVSLVTSKDFAAFWRGVEDGRYDIVQYNQYHYIRSASTYRVIAHNKEFGRSTLAGAIYVRKDSGITDLKQLRGRTILFGGGQDAMISYIAPMYMLLQAGLKTGDFKSQFAVNPINSVIGVYRKQADAAGSGDNAIGQPALRNAVNTNELALLATSDQLLHLPWAVKHRMPAQARQSIQNALITLEKSESGKVILATALLTGIGKAEDRDYEVHRGMVRAVLSNLP